MGKIIYLIKRRLAALAGVVIIAAPGVFMAGTAVAASPWNLNGYYNITFTCAPITPACPAGNFVHDATISGQDSSGNFNVAGGYPAGGPYAYAWNGTGNISGSAVTMSVDYTKGAPNTHMNMTGTVAPNGTMSGTWSDNLNGGNRTGNWTTSVGSATNVSNVIVVTPANQQGWSTADTRPGGAVTFVNDSTSPAPNGALQLTTDATNAAKAQYLHSASTPLSSVNSLSYSTKHVAGPAVADPSYQLLVCLTGGTGACPDFTTFVYEPYENGTVVPGAWQTWDVSAGQFWSSRSFTSGACSVTAGSGGAPFYTLQDIQTMCPNANVIGYGVNVGTFNPGYNVETDLFNFNGNVYDFQLTNAPSNANQCKNGGYVNYTDNNGNAFKNQGQCVSFVNSNRNHTKIHNTNNVTISNNNTQHATSGNAKVNNNTTGGNATSGGASNSNSNTNTVNITNNPTF